MGIKDGYGIVHSVRTLPTSLLVFVAPRFFAKRRQIYQTDYLHLQRPRTTLLAYGKWIPEKLFANTMVTTKASYFDYLIIYEWKMNASYE